MEATELEWMDYGLCNGVEASKVAMSFGLSSTTELFFPDSGQRAQLNAAAKICRGCVVQEECLEYALREDIEDGVWGGTSGRERRRIRSARRKR